MRGNDRPFGGIQLVLAGDFLQLPPVTRKKEERTFCFETAAWKKSVHVNLELTNVKRQSDSRDAIQCCCEIHVSDVIFQN